MPDLARAAFDAGADSVVMAGRLLGFIPDVETLSPMLGTSLGVGGFWNLPLTCHWLAASRAALGPDKPLIGINGAQSGLDIARMMLAGASAVAMASPVMLRGFGLLEDSLRDFSGYLSRHNLRAADLIGRAADQRKTFADMPLRTDNWRKYVPKAVGRARRRSGGPRPRDLARRLPPSERVLRATRVGLGAGPAPGLRHPLARPAQLRSHVQQARRVAADHRADVRLGELQVEQLPHDRAVALDRTRRAVQAEVGAQHRVVDARDLDQVRELVGPYLFALPSTNMQIECSM